MLCCVLEGRDRLSVVIGCGVSEAPRHSPSPELSDTMSAPSTGSPTETILCVCLWLEMASEWT